MEAVFCDLGLVQISDDLLSIVIYAPRILPFFTVWYILGLDSVSNYSVTELNMHPRLSKRDLLDYQIVRALHKNARVTASEIARASGANERTIRKRIDWLVEGG